MAGLFYVQTPESAPISFSSEARVAVGLHSGEAPRTATQQPPGVLRASLPWPCVVLLRASFCSPDTGRTSNVFLTPPPLHSCKFIHSRGPHFSCKAFCETGVSV